MSVQTNDGLVSTPVFSVDAGNIRSYSGATWDDLIGTNDGTFPNGKAFDTGNGGAFLFDGVDEYALFSNTSTGWPVTMGCWVNPRDVGNSPTYMAQSDFSVADKLFGFGSVLDGSNNRVFRIYTYNGSFFQALTTILNNTYTWYHIVGVFESDTSKKLYINGNLEATLTDTVTYPTGTDTLSLSSFQRSGSPSGGYLNGLIARANVYNRALNDEEVLQNYNQTKHRYL